MTTDTVDFIVIGSGSGGSVVGGRLAESGKFRVVLLEAGGSDQSLFIQMPAATYLYALANPRYDWSYESQPDPSRQNRTDILPRGKVLGGCTSINGMLYVRGQREDYDDWAEQGCPGWDFDSVLPWFKKSEDNENGESALHGKGGPLSVSNLRVSHPLSDAFLKAWGAAGLPVVKDINEIPQDGMGYVQITQRKGRRLSTARAFLRPAMRKGLIDVRMKARVLRVLFEGTKAVGVEYLRHGKRFELRAIRGVVLSAGAFATPQLLLLSGIGPAAHLARMGIPVIKDLPGVGRNLQEHPGFTLDAAMSIPSYNTQNTIFHKAWYGAQWLSMGRGPGTTPDTHLVGFARSEPGLDRCDLQYHFGPVGYTVDENGAILTPYSSVSAFMNVSRPYSRGWVELASPDPLAQPAIQMNLLEDRRDIDVLIKGAKLMTEVFKTEPFGSLLASPVHPTDSMRTEADWEGFIRKAAHGIYHPAGTCKMGQDEMAVVGPTLAVRGVRNLWVADASIMPMVTSGNLSAPTMMIGERLANTLIGN